MDKNADKIVEAIFQKFDEFACLHNHVSSDFMSNEKFERFSLRKMKAVDPFHWDLLDESGLKVVEKIVEDKDQVLQIMGTFWTVPSPYYFLLP